MKPFDLEAAKRGEPICCAGGASAKFVAYEPDATEDQRVIVLLGGGIDTCWSNGSYLGNGQKSSRDLRMASRKRTVWVNVRPSWNGDVFQLEADADSDANLYSYKRLGNRAWPLEIEE